MCMVLLLLLDEVSKFLTTGKLAKRWFQNRLFTTVGTVDLSSALQVAIEAQKHTFDWAQRKWLDRNDIVTPISTTWQNMQGGSSMLGTCHISSSRPRRASLAVALG